jgi:putative glutamine amidotransferase
MQRADGRPIIGITVGTSLDWRTGMPSYESYASAIRAAGGECRRMGKGASMNLEKVSGLLVPGGWDIYPDRYDRLPGDEHLSADDVKKRYKVRCEEARDDTELPLLRQALDMGMPVLAICRGIQALNVVLARKLIPDIPSVVPNALRHKSMPGPTESLSHEVDIEAGSLIERAYGRRRLLVNTRHHQGLTRDMVSPQLIVTAIAPDGIVEAVESLDSRFIVGVQWHPERKRDAFIHDISGPLFEAFVEACVQKGGES